jgi:hypothetical protein
MPFHSLAISLIYSSFYRAFIKVDAKRRERLAGFKDSMNRCGRCMKSPVPTTTFVTKP